MADEFKAKGNNAYNAGDFDEAVNLYTLGIEQEPSNPALFSNRSAAYLKLQNYERARRDAEMCIELDKTWSKVRFFLDFSSRANLSAYICSHHPLLFRDASLMFPSEGKAVERPHKVPAPAPAPAPAPRLFCWSRC